MKFFGKSLAVFVTMFAAAAVAPSAHAEESYTIAITNHRFEPQTLNVPAGKKIELTVKNNGTESAEFESAELNREKVVPAGGSVKIYVGPLEPGSYPFFDDFHQSTKGRIVAK